MNPNLVNKRVIFVFGLIQSNKNSILLNYILRSIYCLYYRFNVISSFLFRYLKPSSFISTNGLFYILCFESMMITKLNFIWYLIFRRLNILLLCPSDIRSESEFYWVRFGSDLNLTCLQLVELYCWCVVF